MADSMLVALVFVVTINVLMILANASIIGMGGSDVFINYNGSIVGHYVQTSNGMVYVNENGMTTELPNSNSGIEPTGNFFIDSFASVKAWFTGIGTGIDYFKAVVTAPYNLLKLMMPDPSQSVMVAVLGTFWYAISFFIIISYMWWR